MRAERCGTELRCPCVRVVHMCCAYVRNMWFAELASMGLCGVRLYVSFGLVFSRKGGSADAVTHSGENGGWLSLKSVRIMHNVRCVYNFCVPFAAPLPKDWVFLSASYYEVIKYTKVMLCRTVHCTAPLNMRAGKHAVHTHSPSQFVGQDA